MTMDIDRKTMNGLRGFFTCCIVFFHMGGEFGYLLSNVFGLFYQHGGNLGNAFFFMSSGYLIMKQYGGGVFVIMK